MVHGFSDHFRWRLYIGIVLVDENKIPPVSSLLDTYISVCQLCVPSPRMRPWVSIFRFVAEWNLIEKIEQPHSPALLRVFAHISFAGYVHSYSIIHIADSV